MKFEYDGKEDTRECVAYIDENGNLRIRDTGRKTEKRGSVCFTELGIKNGYDFSPTTGTRKFYPGDKITITF